MDKHTVLKKCRIHDTTRKVWCGYLRPDEQLFLLNNGAKLNLPAFEFDKAEVKLREKTQRQNIVDDVKSGKCNPTWFYFVLK